ncbi:MAG: ATP-binding protein [Spirochaetes bacterium]|nr:ATP-binding protein [Spirochaetota bacterium]
MILTHIEYFENKERPNFWKIEDINLNKMNLVVGLNATGKSRLIAIISNLALILQKKKLLTGHWKLKYKHDNNSYIYNLDIEKGIVEKEEIIQNDTKLLYREKDHGTILEIDTSDLIEFAPPRDELTINVRRDLKKHPFLELLINWSKHLHAYSFSGVKPNEIIVPGSPEALLQGLNTVPYLLSKGIENNQFIDKILKDFKAIGYPIDKISIRQQQMPNGLSKIPLVMVKENDLKCATEQGSMSQGMFRALALLVIIEYIINQEGTRTILIDDLGEGLDYDRATRLTNLLFKKLENSNIQLIASSNNRFLINSVNIRYINFLKRKGHIVKSYNYSNSKEKFEQIKLAGLNNFDLFTGNIFN